MTDMHDSDCATHNEPAMRNGPCDCSLKEPSFWIIEEGYNDMMLVDRVGGDAPRYVGIDDYERLEQKLEKTKRRLERENAELRKDAERYRYLINANPDDGPHVVTDRQDDWGNWRNDILSGVVLDEAIDAAIKEQSHD